jgi:hypothetical protein
MFWLLDLRAAFISPGNRGRPFEHATRDAAGQSGDKEVTIDGDRETGRILCLNPMVPAIADPDGRPRVGFHGLWYVDEYVRSENGWRIARRIEERCFSHNFPASKTA